MKRIVCLSILVFFLCTGTALANSKFEAGLFFGSYQPSFSRFHEEFDVWHLKGKSVRGCSFGYEIAPRYKIHIQIDFFKSKVFPTSPIGVELRTTSISVLGIVDLFYYRNRKIYGGIGLIDRRVKAWRPWYGDHPILSIHDFGHPWGTMLLFGLAISPIEPYQLKGEIQYVTGSDGELFSVPLDWDGFKFLVSFGIKL